jgi:hypothetical protein
MLSAPTRRLETTGRDLPPTAIGGLLMTDSPNTTNPRGFPPLACHAHKEG